MHAGAPSAATSLNFQVLANSSEEMAQVPVNVSWDSPESAQEFILQISNMDYDNIIRSLINSVTVLLPYGTYSATLCTRNRCGTTMACRDFPNIVIAEPQPRPEETVSDSK
jgi:hypothetical protein